jgi:hypothetical protein
VLSFLFCFLISFGLGFESDGFIRGPGGGMYHPDCHVGMFFLLFSHTILFLSKTQYSNKKLSKYLKIKIKITEN